jgi:hypothetical protein
MIVYIIPGSQIKCERVFGLLGILTALPFGLLGILTALPWNRISTDLMSNVLFLPKKMDAVPEMHSWDKGIEKAITSDIRTR